MDKDNKTPSRAALLKTLDFLYEKALKGIPHASSSVEELAEIYLKGDTEPEKAAKTMLKSQIIKCTATGVITGIGGFSTLPVSIPANVAGILYMQLRMIACAAQIAGYDIYDPVIRAYTYACLSGVSIRGVERDVDDIRERAAVRLLAKTGEKGVLNLAKLIPLIGAGVNGGIDYVGTKTVADRAYGVFFENKRSFEEEKSLYRRGADLYKKHTGKDLGEDVKAFAARQKKNAGNLWMRVWESRREESGKDD